jgi:hypothetical protein
MRRAPFLGRVRLPDRTMPAATRSRAGLAALQPASALLACGFAALPKCPLCLMSLATALGVGSIPLLAWAPRIVPFALAAAIAPLVWGAVARRNILPLAIGAVSAAVLLADWIAGPPRPPNAPAIAGLAVASIWNAWRARAPLRDAPCTHAARGAGSAVHPEPAVPVLAHVATARRNQP